MAVKHSLTKAEIKGVCDKLRMDDGVGAKDYIEQFSWLLFLRVFEGVELQLRQLSEADGHQYVPVVDTEYTWSAWARKDWKNKDELIHFVNQKLFPYLKALKGTQEKEKVAEVFREMAGNRIHSPHTLLDVIDVLDRLEMADYQDTHLLSQVYEEILQEMGSEGGWSGEFYTPRPIIRLMVNIIDPKLGEVVLDPFVGSAGFLIESFDHIQKANASLGVPEWRQLRTKTFYGQEKKSLPFLIGNMNMILHYILVPNLTRTNTFNEDVHNVSDSAKMDVILTNPPFGAEENASVQGNFPIPVSATDALALQYVAKRLKAGGRCGIILPESDVIFGSGKYMEIRKALLGANNLYAVIALPKGVFKQVGADVKSYLLFFEKTGPTKETWYHEIEGNYSRTHPISDKELSEVHVAYEKREVSSSSWLVSIEELSSRDYNLRAINPHKKVQKGKEPAEVLKDVLATIQGLNENAKYIAGDFASVKSGKVAEHELSTLLERCKESVTIKDSGVYKRVTIQMHGKGVKMRDETGGDKIGTKRQFLIKSGQLLISKIDARNGAYGVVPPECDGAIITGNFWAYDINSTSVDPRYFSFILRSAAFLDFFEKASQGATNRRYLQEKLFLKEKIVLPAIEIQKKLLKELDSLADVKESAQKLSMLVDELERSIVNTD